jgi:alkyl hydroperoxide reductase subunit AhpC
MQLRDHKAVFSKRNLNFAVITFENEYSARMYVEETCLSWPLLIDENRETYRNYGMLSASFGDVWGPKTWWVYLKEILKGQKLKKSPGDIFQRGGDVLIDPTGIVRLHHISTGPADRPTVEMILHRMGIEKGAEPVTAPDGPQRRFPATR